LLTVQARISSLVQCALYFFQSHACVTVDNGLLHMRHPLRLTRSESIWRRTRRSTQSGRGAEVAPGPGAAYQLMVK